MDYQSYKNLQWIDAECSMRGKYAQLVLGGALQRAGFTVENVQLVEGFDIQIRRAGNTYGLEVKTTDGDTVALQEKDLGDIQSIRERGMIPGFAVLRMAPAADWWISKPDPALIEKKRTTSSSLRLPITAFRPRPLDGLQEAVRQEFDEVLREAVRTMKQEGYSSSPNLGVSDLKVELGLS
jgi:hypothetical protein